MLTQLTINNFAIVRQLDIELEKGMSVITGETGTGKSIAIDALGLCLGQRTELSMIREGQERTEVCASFYIQPNNIVAKWLEQNDLQDQDNPENCILRRIINQDGRSKAFINSTPVSANQLKEISSFLLHINGQHSSQLLLKNEFQLQTLDNFCDHSSLIIQMKNSYNHWKTLQQKLAQFKQLCTENEAKKQLLQYQVEELNEFNLQPNEFEELEETHKRLSSSEELTSLSQSLLTLLSENETVSADSLLYKATQYAAELTELDPKYSSIQTMLEEALIQVQEAINESQSLASAIEQDPSLLEQVEKRMSKAIYLAKKHQISPENLVNFHRSLKAELAQLIDYSGSEEELVEQEKQAFIQMQNTATELHNSRKIGANKLAQQVTQSIKQLAMENAEFFIKVVCDENKITANGFDTVQFDLQSNLGQSAQPLSKTASGGELSRIALAIQVLTSDKNAIPTLIFDEIDVGISGTTANVVGKLLRKLSEKCQVLCVTHLPQVASHAHHHFMVEKLTVDEKTETKMTALSNKQRVNALAKLLGGSKITESVLANAQEMLDLANK